LLTGLLEAMSPKSLVVLESTPNGVGGHFYDLWQDKDNGWLKLFYPWWWDAQYRLPLLETDELGHYSDEEAFLMATHGIVAEQVKWRREKIKMLREMFYQEYPENDIDCFLSSGMPYFDSEALKVIEKRDIMDPVRVVDGVEYWEDPQPGHIYVTSADVAEGVGGDFSVAQVWDITTGHQVAQLRANKMSVSVFATRVCALAGTYNGSMLAPERNNHGHAFLNQAINVTRYENIYLHEEYDYRIGTKKKVPGFPTTQVTKPVMLSDLDAAIMEGAITIRSRALLTELRTMSHNGKGGVEAISGCHDDTVITAGIAWQIRKVPARFQHVMEYFTQSGSDADKIVQLRPETGEYPDAKLNW
jgi:hypothetical protein